MICNSGGKQLQDSIFATSNTLCIYLKLKFGVICRLNIAMLSGRVHKVASYSTGSALMIKLEGGANRAGTNRVGVSTSTSAPNCMGAQAQEPCL